ncbi:histidine kinase [Saccharopolyspora shandongensis]|uniref:histidine kinase n=1 Tax=Saccharopolyspora shandongensis TaxID=418495 RepID=UPI00341D7959
MRLATETDRLCGGDAAARELADYRWRATVEMAQERRALERDLHDAAQHHLVALRMALSLVEHAGAATEQRLGILMSKLDTEDDLTAPQHCAVRVAAVGRLHSPAAQR